MSAIMSQYTVHQLGNTAYSNPNPLLKRSVLYTRSSKHLETGPRKIKPVRKVEKVKKVRDVENEKRKQKQKRKRYIRKRSRNIPHYTDGSKKDTGKGKFTGKEI